MQIIHCPDQVPHEADAPIVFLAGPSLADNLDGGWRDRALAHLAERFYGIVLHPEPTSAAVPVELQAKWDFDGCDRAGAIAFWVPREQHRLPGLTTNFELGLWLRSGKVVVGYPTEAHAMSYVDATARRFGAPVSNSLFETLDLATELAVSRHFSRDR